jgi:hypothetical protein
MATLLGVSHRTDERQRDAIAAYSAPGGLVAIDRRSGDLYSRRADGSSGSPFGVRPD